jgi:hypothetical protein
MLSTLNYHPSLGELLVTLLLAIIAAPIAHPLVKLIAKLWAQLVDKISGSFAYLRKRQIRRLERRVEILSDSIKRGRISVRAIEQLGMSIVLITVGMFGVTLMWIKINNEMLFDSIAEFIADTSKLNVVVQEPPSIFSYIGLSLRSVNIFTDSMVVSIAVITILVGAYFISGLRELTDAEDTINTLQMRITALRTK